MQLQPPTATHLRIRNTADAHKLFHAVYLNMLPMVVRRLDAEERKMIKSGDVHVWEERGPGTEATGLGIERWTDGRLWGPSRVRDCFLFYHEKDREPEDFHGGSKWARMLSGGVVVFRRRSPTEGPSSPPYYNENGSDYFGQPGAYNEVPLQGYGVMGSADHCSPRGLDGQYGQDGSPVAPKDRLVKQTYSVLVHLPGQTNAENTVVRKWHMTAYFSSSQAAQNALRTVDDIPAIAALQSPEGMYEPARAGRVGSTGGRARSSSHNSMGKSVQIPPVPASMLKPTMYTVPSQSSPTTPRSAAGSFPLPHANAASRYTPYTHRSTPASPTTSTEMQDRSLARMNLVVPSQNTVGWGGNTLPPLRPRGFSVDYPKSSSMDTNRLRLLNTIDDGNDARSRSSSISSLLSVPATATSTASNSTESSSLPSTPPLLALSTPSSELTLAPLSFLENVRASINQPSSWNIARRAVDEEAVRYLDCHAST